MDSHVDIYWSLALGRIAPKLPTLPKKKPRQGDSPSFEILLLYSSLAIPVTSSVDEVLKCCRGIFVDDGHPPKPKSLEFLKQMHVKHLLRASNLNLETSTKWFAFFTNTSIITTSFWSVYIGMKCWECYKEDVYQNVASLKPSMFIKSMNQFSPQWNYTLNPTPRNTSFLFL